MTTGDAARLAERFCARRAKNEDADVPKTITIDASAATGGIDFATYLDSYYADLKTGASSFYGGTADPAPYGYQNGTQVGFRFKDQADAATTKQVLVEGIDLAYDFAHYGSTFGHGISG